MHNNKCTHIITWKYACTKPVQAYSIFTFLITVVTLIQLYNLMLSMSSHLMQLCNALDSFIPAISSVTVNTFQLF